MRVLLVTHRYPPDGVGGVEGYVERLRAALEETGDAVDVLTRTPSHFPRRPRLVRAEGALRIVGSGCACAISSSATTRSSGRFRAR